MRIKKDVAPGTRQPPIGGWTSYCRLAILLAAAEGEVKKDGIEHDRGH